jgi:glycosyltransferase involved in cell wall biosynthesis
MNKRKLSLTIVIPVFNEQEHLKNCLDALAVQTAKPDEVLVVDNNSTDRSVLVAQQYSFVRVVPAKQQGIAYARNAGFDAAESDLIGRIDADTILPETWVSDVMEFYATHEDAALTGGGYFYNVPLPRFNGWVLGQLAYRLNRFILGHYIVWGSNMVLPAAAWRRVRNEVCSTRTDVHEDLDLGIHLHAQGTPIYYQESLRVGVEMKRVYKTDGQVHKQRMNMWPNTLRAHHIRRAWLGQVGAWILYQGRFVVRAGNAVTTMYRIGREMLKFAFIREP